jgi:hypothetical protein
MSRWLFLLVFMAPQSNFSEFSFCREGTRGGDPVPCIRLNERGGGSFTPDSATDDVGEPLELSAGPTGSFLQLLGKTGYLRDGGLYESGRNVANLGRKILAVEGEWGRREAVFNYSDRSEVNDLVAFMDRLISQESLLLELAFALDFDRLGLPAMLDRVEGDLRRNRLPDAHRFLDTLRRIGSDPRVVGYARTAARRLVEDIEDD